MSSLQTLLYPLAIAFGGGLLGYFADRYQSLLIGGLSFACIPLAIFIFIRGSA